MFGCRFKRQLWFGQVSGVASPTRHCCFADLKILLRCRHGGFQAWVEAGWVNWAFFGTSDVPEKGHRSEFQTFKLSGLKLSEPNKLLSWQPWRSEQSPLWVTCARVCKHVGQMPWQEVDPKSVTWKLGGSWWHFGLGHQMWRSPPADS